MIESDNANVIRNKTNMLGTLYPETYAYESRSSLWQLGLRDGLVSNELYESARIFYGRLWNYVGD